MFSHKRQLCLSHRLMISTCHHLTGSKDNSCRVWRTEASQRRRSKMTEEQKQASMRPSSPESFRPMTAMSTSSSVASMNNRPSTSLPVGAVRIAPYTTADLKTSRALGPSATSVAQVMTIHHPGGSDDDTEL